MVIQRPEGNLYPQHAIYLSLMPKRQGICNHFIGICGLLSQMEGLRPISQILHIRVSIGGPGPPWFIKIILRTVPALSFHAEAGGPFSVQRNVPGSGQSLVPPLQQQIRVMDRIRVRIGVSDEKAVKFPFRPHFRSGEDQKDACAGIILQQIETFRKVQVQQPAFQFLRSKKPLQPCLLVLQKLCQDIIHELLLFPDGGPALVHVIL